MLIYKSKNKLLENNFLEGIFVNYVWDLNVFIENKNPRTEKVTHF